MLMFVLGAIAFFILCGLVDGPDGRTKSQKRKNEEEFQATARAGEAHHKAWEAEKAKAHCGTFPLAP
jgi:hypothetical protein